MNHGFNFKFSRRHAKKAKTHKNQAKLILIIYFVYRDIAKILLFQYVINIKITNKIVYILFLPKSSKFNVYFTLPAYLNSDYPHFNGLVDTCG